MIRIIITGDSGRGKTTLAHRISSHLHIPVYSTDDFYFTKKFTIKRDMKDALQLAQDAASKKSWIIEGTSKALITPGLERSDLVLYLRYKSFLKQAARVIRRSLSRPHERMTDTFNLLWFLFNKRYRITYRKEPTLDYVKRRSNNLIILDSFRDIGSFLSCIRERYKKEGGSGNIGDNHGQVRIYPDSEEDRDRRS